MSVMTTWENFSTNDVFAYFYWNFVWALAWPRYNLINSNDLDYSRIQISRKKTYGGIYVDMILNVFKRF